MHCLGAVTGGIPNPNGVGSRGSILSVFRALGVLVCEGRIQGPPRGYKEGPHCAPPMQAPPNDHKCEENKYLCDRYLILFREITDRTAIGSFLCVEVLLCSDCPCGLAKATCKNPVCPLPSLSISPWQQTSEMLLEYWCICVVPSKSTETMNFQGLYQAVRSRLHFSQVAAWWSRSNGYEPRYIATRVVPHNEENLRKFRENPVEHTFPLAGSGDGNSIKVTVWALPRMEEVPFLTCPLHPIKEKDEESVARALTPTKTNSASSASQNPENLVMPALVDDRLQTPCNKSGKHHCRCEEEDCPPPSPTFTRSNGERKRRRSLPCGPPDINASVTLQPVSLPSVQESASTKDPKDTTNASSSYPKSTAEISKNHSTCGNGTKTLQKETSHRFDRNIVRNRNNLNSDNLERNFKMRLSIDEREGNMEKRYKRTIEAEKSLNEKEERSRESNIKIDGPSDAKIEKNGLFDNLIPFNSSLPWSFVESWNNSAANGKCGFQSLRANKEMASSSSQSSRAQRLNESSSRSSESARSSSPFKPTDAQPSVHGSHVKLKLESVDSTSANNAIGSTNTTNVATHRSRSRCNLNKPETHEAVSPANEALELENETKSTTNCSRKQKDLSHLMSKLSFPDEKERTKEEGGFLDWFSRVPGRVLGVAPTNGYIEEKVKNGTASKPAETHGNEVKLKSCNLELSQREFDEVLAVLRARTPSGRRRAPVKTVRRRDRSEKSLEDGAIDKRSSTSLENGENLSNTAANHGRQSCEGCGHDLCKRTEQRVPFDRRFCNKQYQVEYGCQKDPKQNLHNASNVSTNISRNISTNISTSVPTHEASYSSKGHLETRSNNSDCLQSVSNKADVLLGAILRTSKDRKDLQDTSNGTRPRTVRSSARNDDEKNNSEINTNDKMTRECKNVTLEDERSLPLSLNKRFNRFRQLFKKEQNVEQNRRSNSTNEGCSQDVPSSTSDRLNPLNFHLNDAQQNSQNSCRSMSKGKRRIDYSKYTEYIEEEQEEIENECQDSQLSTNGAHQNSSIHSTNYKRDGRDVRGYDREEMMLVRRAYLDQCERLQSTKRAERNVRDDSIEYRDSFDDERATSIGSTTSFEDTISFGTKDCLVTVTSKNEHVSSNARNNNNNIKDDKSLTEDESFDKAVPSAIEQERFRRSLENAASMVFHSRTGLPLTSSPAPLRRGSCCFDYDSSLNSVSSKRSALFELNTPPSPDAVSLEEADREAEIAGDGEETPKRRSTSRHRPQSHALLGSFEESALNGRLEPVSTVHGFTAELGASGSFCPKHRKLPVTVFFYTLGDNDKVSTPYLAHINLGKKGYQVPRSGTIQVTLLNPLGTVVKMFVVLYDLSDMPPRSHTFLRQRTLRDKTLRYLVHLRFMSSKSGRIYLHTDIRMIICRKSDVDTASDLGSEPPKELRSYTHGPTNPKFSPRC